MNVFDLAAAIHLDKTNYDKGLDESESKGKSWTSKMGETFSKVGSMASKALATASKIGAAAIGAGATAVGTLAKMAVSEYADYEQLLGGVETLYSGTQQTLEEFAESTERTTDEALDDWLRLTTGQRIVANNAEEAYKTVGLSMNEYMETATSFAAALASSLEGDTTAAANAADMAITDMADNANKMGTQMESIQNAYNGFSKQNYTMLDNLKLGYGGTKEEMERLIKDANELNAAQGNYTEYSIDSFADIVNAIHDVQTNMGITGTTAKEAASTISGSMAMAKAAWKNLTTALAADESEELPIQAKVEEFVDSVKTAASNVIPRVELAIAGVGQLVNELLPMIVAEIPVIASSILPDLVTTGIALVGALIDGIIQNGPSLMTEITNILNMITSGFISEAPAAITLGADIIVNLINGFTSALPNVVTVAVDMMQVLLDGLSDALPQLIPVALAAVLTFAESLLDNSDKIIDSAIKLITSLVQGIVNSIPLIVEKVPTIIVKFVGAVTSMAPKLVAAGIEMIVSLGKGIIQAVPTLVKQVPTIIKSLISAYKNEFAGLISIGAGILDKIGEGISGAVGNFVNKVIEFFTPIVNAIGETIGNGIGIVTEKIASIVDTVIEVVGSVIEYISGVFETIGNVIQVGCMLIGEIISAAVQIITLPFRFIWENCKEYVFNAWDVISSYVSEKLTAISQTVNNAWTAIKSFMIPILEAIRNTAVTAWEAIKTAVTTVVNTIKTVIETVWNGIKTVITTVSETTKTVVLTIWEAIKAGITTILNAIKTVFETIWNGIKIVVTTVTNAIKTAIINPIKSAYETVKGVLENIKNAFGDKLNAAKQIVKNAIETIKGFFHFEWQLPHLKMPHPKIEGEFSLNPPSVPHFSIEWYKKAMNEPMIMTKPTAFGINNYGQLMAGGEAGSEVVSGTDTLMNMIENAVEKHTGNDGTMSSAILAMLIDIRNLLKNLKVVLDSGELVGGLVEKMDEALGDMVVGEGRSV